MIVRIATLAGAFVLMGVCSRSVSTLRRRCAVPGDTFARDQEKCVRVLYQVKPVLTIPTVVYLFLINYGRSKADSIHMVIPNFLQVRYPINFLPFVPGPNYLCRTAMTATPSFERSRSAQCLIYLSPPSSNT